VVPLQILLLLLAFVPAAAVLLSVVARTPPPPAAAASSLSSSLPLVFGLEMMEYPIADAVIELFEEDMDGANGVQTHRSGLQRLSERRNTDAAPSSDCKRKLNQVSLYTRRTKNGRERSDDCKKSSLMGKM
jgi:hypothetical protein